MIRKLFLAVAAAVICFSAALSLAQKPVVVDSLQKQLYKAGEPLAFSRILDWESRPGYRPASVSFVYSSMPGSPLAVSWSVDGRKIKEEKLSEGSSETALFEIPEEQKGSLNIEARFQGSSGEIRILKVSSVLEPAPEETAGASGDTPHRAEKMEFASVRQSNAAMMLRALSKPQPEVIWNPVTMIPEYLRCRLSFPGLSDPAAIVLEFFSRFRDLYRIQDPARELKLVQVAKDRAEEGGMTHLRLIQMHGGYEVYGAEVLVHLSRANEIVLVQAKLLPALEVPAKPALSIPEFLSKIEKNDFPGKETSIENAKVVIYNPHLFDARAEDRPALCWMQRIRVEGFIGEWIVFTDSATGKTLYKSRDVQESAKAEIFSLEGKCGAALPGEPIFKTGDDRDGPSKLASRPRAKAASEIMEKIDRYWSDTFGRNSFDGRGSPLKATVDAVFFDGKYDVFTASAPDLSMQFIGAGTAESLRVLPPLPAKIPWKLIRQDGLPSVTIYDQENFSGKAQTFFASVPDLAVTEFGERGIRSLRVNGPCRAALYPETGFKGKEEVLDASRSDLKESGPEGKPAASLAILPPTSMAPAAKGPGGLPYAMVPSLLQQFYGVPDARVLLYGKKNYGGPAETFTSSNPDFKQTLGGPHPVSSLAIEGNATAILFEKPGYNCESNAAYWIGGDGLAAFGEGWVVEDILMHEWTHALTAHTARLEYRNESGALNESFSDVFACFLDSDDWTIGEDLPHGPIRSLQNPPGYGQPDRVADTRQLPDDREHDWGGVHTNSGIPNKAAWLMTDGGALEGVTVRGIGRKKAEQIYYRALTAHLMPASDFRDGALALLESARELEGTHDITPQDTESVRSALVAVGMLPAGDLYGEIRP